MSDNDSSAVVTPTTILHPARWQPVVGDETKGVVERKRLPSAAGAAIVETAVSILSKGVEPGSGAGQKTGLVVGYVQSGKTLSFTTAIALARDNGYRLVVVIAGTSVSLLNQSTQRLRADLFVDDVEGSLRWATFKNPTNADARAISGVLGEWQDPQVPDREKRTVLITVMKNHRHLMNLNALLRQLGLTDVPALIIDDEADQASLNTLVDRGDESTTYRRILELREAMPCHTFLQYTATPQAPLLINLIDFLSPEFVDVLDPGEDYVGGNTFFNEAEGLVREIPWDDVPTADQPLVDPPDSLLEALRVFMVGVAAGLIQGRSRSNANRSMLIHPSVKRVQHQEYTVWVNHVFDEWRQVLDLPENDPDRADLIEDFQEAHANLVMTVPEIPVFDEIVKMMPRAFRLTNVQEVNTRVAPRTPTVDWTRSYGWVLVGGQAMDRGFTVEGLTVTYMPRSAGVGNADTIQQRGRFFGYKRPYLGFCRTYLESEVLEAFQNYVTHEEEMRVQLKAVQSPGSLLKEWKRVFILDPALSLCRRNVLQYEYVRGGYSDKWFEPKVILNAGVIQDNQETVRRFLDRLTFIPDEGDSARQEVQKHEVIRDVPLVHAIQELLTPYRFTSPRDTREITGILLQLSRALDLNKNEHCLVYKMSPGYLRRRSVDDKGHIPNLFQGAFPVNPPKIRGSVYPGDRGIRSADDVTIQVHHLELEQHGKVVASNVPVVAIWIPRRMHVPWAVQEQP